MKIMKRTFAILTLALVTFSCSKDDAPAIPLLPPTADYFLKAKIDGNQYQTDAPFRVLAGRNDDRLTINSVLADNRNFELKISGVITAGTYNYPAAPSDDYSLSLSYDDGSSASSIWRTGVCTGTTGTLTITSYSATEVSGTFSFTGKRTGSCADAAKSITEGSFKSGITQ